MIKSVDAPLLEAIRTARAKARERAWEAGARPREIVLDIDATLITAHSEKEDAAGNYKGGFGFQPLLCYLSETGEPLAGLLRAGNAGSNTAADHFEVLQSALEQLQRIRQRLLHVAGRIVHSGRRTILRLPCSWPWAGALATAFTQLRSLPGAGRAIARPPSPSPTS